MRASIVLDYYSKEIEAMSDDQLSFADKEKKQQVLNLIKYMGSLKVIDAPVLMKLYDLYRLKLWWGLSNSHSHYWLFNTW